MPVSNQFLSKTIMTTKPIVLYNSEQLYAMEQAWFEQGNSSFALMQQAAWQMAQHIESVYDNKYLNQQLSEQAIVSSPISHQRRASIWVGKGNNGGDGWLVAYYLQQQGWQVNVIAVGFEKSDFIIKDSLKASEDEESKPSITNTNTDTDAARALQLALYAGCEYQYFENSEDNENGISVKALQAEVYVDALFGIGFNRAPSNIYQQAIYAFNKTAKNARALVIAVDIPSGLVASTGQVFDDIAISADITLCLIARKFGLHTKDGLDYSGVVIDIPLIPHLANDKSLLPIASLMNAPYQLKPRQQNSHKGSYGHVLVIGGNRIDGSQGMGGAAILSASSAMAAGTGKITVACHKAFHGALLTSLPDAMSMNLHDTEGVKRLIKEASVVAIGMGLGRDDKAQLLFTEYLQTAITEGKPIIIDADGLYHLASLHSENHKLIAALKIHSTTYQLCLTPHSGEAARLLKTEADAIESDRFAAIIECAAIYGGDWVLKGAGSLILEQQAEQPQVYVCGVGNAGMASAGMGDVLAGVIAGLLAQKDLRGVQCSLHQAVMIHGLAGDVLVNQKANDHSLMIGQRGLQAQDMPAAIRYVMHLITDSH